MGGFYCIKLILVPLLISFVVTACDSQEESDPSTFERFGLVNHGECSHSPIEGGDFPPPSPSYSQWTGYFQKFFNHYHFENVMKTSGRDTWAYIHQLGVPIYKVVAEEESQCRYFAALPVAPPHLLQEWKGYDKGRGTLLGLYTTNFRKSAKSGKVTRVNEAILVREDAERWTLVHEFAHHLYSSDRVKQLHLPFREEIKAKLAQLNSEITLHKRSFNKTGTEETIYKIIDLYEQLFSQVYKLDQQGPLEEFTIESQLLERLDQGDLMFINIQHDPFNALRYMNYNRRKVIKAYRMHLTELIEFSRSFQAKKWDKATSRLAQTMSRVVDVLRFMNDKYTEAEAIVAKLKPPTFQQESFVQAPLPQHYDETFYDEAHDFLTTPSTN